jgi:putative membrane protein
MMLIVKWLLSAVALLFIAYIYKGVSVAGFGSALIAALVIGLLNLLVRPILIVLTIPITLVTLGLFLFVINALMFWAALIGSLLYSLLGVLIDRALTGGAGARWV